MTPEQVELVKSTWKMILPIADTAADLFYGKLFELDPEVRALFDDDMAKQKKALMAMIGNAVASLHQIESIVPTVQQLGVRHVGYGAIEGHYATVGEALLWTLEQGLREAWTPEVKAAWVETYTILSTTMLDAARAEAA
ncbi:MAG: hemin receptor [Chloroflexi bacterium]|nr:hemin receptor [Chloroflexota bacterium]